MARLYWGADGKLWGDEQLFWGATEEEVEDLPAVWFHALFSATLSGGVARLWTGSDDLTVDIEDGDGPREYFGAGQCMDVSAVSAQVGPPNDSTRVTINSIPRAWRNRWVIPVNGSPAWVRFIASDDYGFSWSLLPIVREGLLSGPQMQEGVYSVDIVHEYDNRDRSHRLIWSDETQQARHPGDKGMAWMRSLAQGITLKFPHN